MLDRMDVGNSVSSMARGREHLDVIGKSFNWPGAGPQSGRVWVDDLVCFNAACGPSVLLVDVRNAVARVHAWSLSSCQVNLHCETYSI